MHGACKYFGWQYHYVLWGISLVNLLMLIAEIPDTNDKGEKEGDNEVITLDQLPDIINRT